MEFNENLKICLSGNFDSKYFEKNFDNDTAQFTYIDNTNDTSRIIREFDFVFSAADKGEITYYYDSDTQIKVKIEKGTIEECAGGFIRFCNSYVSLDMYDIANALSFENKESFFYGGLTQAEMQEKRELFKQNRGIIVFLRLPSKDYGIEDAQMIADEFFSVCHRDSTLLWGVDFSKDTSEVMYDLYLGAVEE